MTITTVLIKFTKSFITFLFISVLGINASQATLMLRITDTPLTGAPTVITATDQITTGGASTTPDNSPGILGLLSTSFSTPNFFLTASSGVSKPLPPNTNTQADLFLRELAVSSANGGTLTIEISDNDFMLDGLGVNGFLSAGIEGRLGTNPLNTVEVNYFYNTSNLNFDTVGATTLGNGIFSGGYGFNGSYGRIAVNDINQPFSITQIIKIHLEPNFQIMSFESGLQAVPEPDTLFLVGLGLSALIFAARRRNKQQEPFI
ncbi:PEP-CTERM protein-sorting domain-containing protein [Nitrosomonas aestuarii]|uniref:PEP-CTERM protein-sorting domain-containing protein n=1 Tax=Nitrosomonas aestuarii TaxID=52441 RepID=A0A1I3ZF73_9PROT|nr:PEP-CTERM sorting domain-containing protein [Nitrosomonas aestuarii]SFK42798.1 PEP-CTERM protein-sorting domain-containing protein [Nitrosomonas aestuarii]